MLTGTPLDLTPFGSLLNALGLLYWAVVLGVMAMALWLPKSWQMKLAVAAIMGGIFVGPVALHLHRAKKQRDAAQARLEESMALFKQRCKSAGERIVRTVDGVEGILWMKWRDKEINYSKQFKLDDPYGTDCIAEDCIRMLLRVTSGVMLNPEKAEMHAKGYLFLETVDPYDGMLVRYTANIEETDRFSSTQPNQSASISKPQSSGASMFVLKREPINGVNVRYGIKWEDISSQEDREHWIAGGSIKVIDLYTDEVVAVRIGYLIDPGQGSTAGFRSPWTWAKSYGPRCPLSHESTLEFATKILHPSDKGTRP